MKTSPTPILNRKIRIALCGCGRISENHLASIKALEEDLELVGVCDTAPEALDKAVQKTGAPGFSRLTDMLAGSDADLVALTTPSGLHPEQAIECARAGRHVLTEKPMATRWEDGQRMVRACDEAGVTLFVVKQNRLNPTLQRLKSAMSQKRFGRIYMIVANVFWTRPQSYYDSAAWRGTWEFDGGAFMNQASHYVDLLEWLGGPIESVHAYFGTLARNIQVEDTGTMAIRWRSGAIGSINVTMLTYPKNLEGSITVIGEKGTARIGGMALNEVLAWEFQEALPEDATVFETSYETTSVYGSGHRAYYGNVVRALRGEIEPEVDGREGLKSLELLIAGYKSARDGCRVSLPLDL